MHSRHRAEKRPLFGEGRNERKCANASQVKPSLVKPTDRTFGSADSWSDYSPVEKKISWNPVYPGICPPVAERKNTGPLPAGQF